MTFLGAGFLMAAGLGLVAAVAAFLGAAALVAVLVGALVVALGFAAAGLALGLAAAALGLVADLEAGLAAAFEVGLFCKISLSKDC